MPSKLLLLLAVFTLTATTRAQFQPPAPGTYEEPPILDAATILRPEFARGAHFAVRPEVPTFAGHNSYTIDSDFGIFEADGNAQLMARVQEINAIARLREMSRTDEYKSALKKAAESPAQLAKNLATHPVKTITGVPKGIWKFMNRVGQTVKEAGEERERSPYEERAGADLIGFSKAKRALALKLGVDPYSSNETLQRELNGISWAAYAGSMTVNLALAPVGGTAGNVISGVNLTEAAEGALRDQSPSDLRRIGLGKLLDMKSAREDAVAFLNSTAYSPTNQTLLIDALVQLRGVAGREEYLRLAIEATDEVDALFFRRTAQLLTEVHRETPLAEISARRALPICRAQDGTLVVALEWDYASFTATAEDFVKSLKQETSGERKITGWLVVLGGVASPLVKEHLRADGIQLTEKALPGPLQ